MALKPIESDPEAFLPVQVEVQSLPVLDFKGLAVFTYQLPELYLLPPTYVNNSIHSCLVGILHPSGIASSSSGQYSSTSE